jgi:hypothetical protein
MVVRRETWPLRWPGDTLYPQKLALTSPTSGGHSVGIVRLRTKATEFLQFIILWVLQSVMSLGPYKCKGKGKINTVQAVEVLRVARGWSSHIFRHSTHRWGQGCQPYAPAAFLPPGRFLVLISVRDWVYHRAIVRQEGLGKLKSSPYPKLEPATFRLIA